MSYNEEEKSAIYRVIKERRDMRHFNDKPIADEVLQKLIKVAQQAPSVGYMQPWRFIRITSQSVRGEIYKLAKTEIEKTGELIDGDKQTYAGLKLEGINDCAEVWVAALMEGRDKYMLGRRTMPEMDLASLSCAIQNIWLAARAEQVGLGWVSFFQPDDIAKLLNMPSDSYPAAVLCMGHVDEFYSEPMLKTAGWDKQRDANDIFFENQWGEKSPLLNS